MQEGNKVIDPTKTKMSNKSKLLKSKKQVKINKEILGSFFCTVWPFLMKLLFSSKRNRYYNYFLLGVCKHERSCSSISHCVSYFVFHIF